MAAMDRVLHTVIYELAGLKVCLFGVLPSNSVFRYQLFVFSCYMSIQIDINVLPHISLNPVAPSYAYLLADNWYNINLYDAGCKVNGHHNCTIACKDPKSVWEDVNTLHNCIAYQTISALLGDGTLTTQAIDCANSFRILPPLRYRFGYSNRSHLQLRL